jgi:hypothetical protein
VALGQSAGPHTVWRGVDNRVYLTCPKGGVTYLPAGKETPFCPSCNFRISPLTNLIPVGAKEPEMPIHEETY